MENGNLSWIRFSENLSSLYPSQLSVMSNKRTKVKFNWLRTAFVSPTKFQKNDVGSARPTRWGSAVSEESSKDSSPNMNTSTSSLGLGELENIKLDTPQGRRVTPPQTRSTQEKHHRPCRLFTTAKVIGENQDFLVCEIFLSLDWELLI